MMVTNRCTNCTAPTPCPTFGPNETFSGAGTAATVPSIYGPWKGDTTTVNIGGGVGCSPNGPRDPGFSKFSIIYVDDPCLDYCARATSVNGINGEAGVAFRQCPCPTGSTVSSSGFKWTWRTGAYQIWYFDCSGGFTNFYSNVIGGAEPAGDVFTLAICGNQITAIMNGVVQTTVTTALNSTCTGRGVVVGDPSNNFSCVDNFSYVDNCGNCC